MDITDIDDGFFCLPTEIKKHCEHERASPLYRQGLMVVSGDRRDLCPSPTHDHPNPLARSLAVVVAHLLAGRGGWREVGESKQERETSASLSL